MSDDAPKQERRMAVIPFGRDGIELNTYEDAWRFSMAVAAAKDMRPKGFDTPEQILIAIQIGAEAGLTPMRALSSIAVINGRASWMANAAKAVIQRAGLLEPGTGFNTVIVDEDQGDKMRAVCTAHRRGMRMPVSYEFSVGDAKRAGLWGKQGPWTQYPKRMLGHRAEGFLMNDHFQDALMGLYTEHEARDISPESGGPSFPGPMREPVPDPLLEGAEAPDGGVFDAEFRSSDDSPPSGESPSSEAGAPASSTSTPSVTEPESEPPVGGGSAPTPESESTASEPSVPTVVPLNNKNGCVHCKRHRRMLEDPTVGHAADCPFRELPLPATVMGVAS